MHNHLLKEKDLKDQCGYCGESLSGKDWNSSFMHGILYRTIRCICGKNNSIKDYTDISSGHDNWNSSSWKSVPKSHETRNNTRKKNDSLESIV